MGVHAFPILNPSFHLPPHPIPQHRPSARALSTLSCASNLDWRSIPHMIIYMFQCYSLKSPHPCLLPQHPKVCSLHLCLFSPAPFFFLKITLAIQGLLCFHINCEIFLSSSLKNATGNLIGIAVNL